MAEPASPGFVEMVPAQRALRVNGRQVRLGSRAFDLLVVFAERPGRLITKAELIDAAWGRDDVGDFNLHVQISALRKQLGKEAIVTVPGRGYLCTLTLRDAARPTAAPAAPPQGHAPPQRLFGREHDIAAVLQLLSEHALVVVTGPGGVGKTSLARAVLQHRRDRHADGTAVVDLTRLASPSEVPAALGAAMGVALGTGEAIPALARALRPLDALVLLDNAEPLVDGVAAIVAALLAACPSLRLLVTSQLQMKHAEAQHYRLDPLPVPAALVGLEASFGYAAVALFDARVRAIDPCFCVNAGNLRATIAVCRAVDGLPLALEVVATRCASLGLPAVQRHLDARLRWPNGHAPFVPDRHQTLSAVMDWSHSLLSPPQQIAFRRLGVFAGGFSLAMVHGVLSDQHGDEAFRIDVLAELVEHSLVSPDLAQPQRYRLLETARAHALERLTAAGETEAAQRLHARTLCSVLEGAYLDCWHLPEADFVERYGPELDNLRCALRWSLQHDVPLAIAMAGASGRLWRWLSIHQEGLHWLERAAALIDTRTPLAAAARLWEAIALQYGESASIEGRAAARCAAALYGQIGDRRGRYLALAHLAYSYRYLGDAEEARLAFAELQRLEDPAWPPSVRVFGARLEPSTASHEQRVATGRAVNETRLALATAAGSDYEVNSALVNLADLALMAGDADEAVARNRALLARLSRRHLASRAIALGNLIEALVVQGSLEQANEAVPEFVDATTRLEFMFGMFAVDALALMAALEARWGTAAHLLGYSDLNYTARHRDRGPNERAIRDRTWALLTAHADASDLQAWMAQGATFTATEVCRLASNPS
ncbi:MAG: winged helix-turn-helix domain-containing protein [Burkholderiales bacterium]|nr:winged helix-turn-helix domain-containing protein [Burkholderiales bacterium]